MAAVDGMLFRAQHDQTPGSAWQSMTRNDTTALAAMNETGTSMYQDVEAALMQVSAGQVLGGTVAMLTIIAVSTAAACCAEARLQRTENEAVSAAAAALGISARPVKVLCSGRLCRAHGSLLGPLQAVGAVFFSCFIGILLVDMTQSSIDTGFRAVAVASVASIGHTHIALAGVLSAAADLHSGRPLSSPQLAVAADSVHAARWWTFRLDSLPRLPALSAVPPVSAAQAAVYDAVHDDACLLGSVLDGDAPLGGAASGSLYAPRGLTSTLTSLRMQSYRSRCGGAGGGVLSTGGVTRGVLWVAGHMEQVVGVM
ncbi:unnamed protein product, partial [Symbiodinium sp. KB8]